MSPLFSESSLSLSHIPRLPCPCGVLQPKQTASKLRRCPRWCDQKYRAPLRVRRVSYAISMSMSRASNAAYTVADCSSASRRSAHTKKDGFFSHRADAPSFVRSPVAILDLVSGHYLRHCVRHIFEKEKCSRRNDAQAWPDKSPPRLLRCMSQSGARQRS